MNEINVKPKEPIGHGKEHVVYPVYHNNSVVKIQWKESEIDPETAREMVRGAFSDSPMYRIFALNEKIFPKIIRIHPNYVELEKLKTAEIQNEFYDNEALHIIIPAAKSASGKDIYIASIPVLVNQFLMQNRYDKDTKTQILGLIQRRNPDQYRFLVKILLLYNEAVKTIQKTEYKLNFFDLHGGNLGTTEEGSIKIIDL